jgi:hypothetical protein
MSAYAELVAASNFSFLRGASHPEELVAAAQVLDLAALAITDRNSLAGVVRAHHVAKANQVPFIVGARLGGFGFFGRCHARLFSLIESGSVTVRPCADAQHRGMPSQTCGQECRRQSHPHILDNYAACPASPLDLSFYPYQSSSL